MDSFFGIGSAELILILLLAGIVMGPQRISQAARWMGKTTAQLQRVSRHFMRQLNTELAAADEGGDLKGAMDDIQALRRQVSDLRKEITTTTSQPLQEGKTAVLDTKEEIKTLIDGPAIVNPDKKNENRISPFPQTPDLPNLVEIPDDPE